MNKGYIVGLVAVALVTASVAGWWFSRPANTSVVMKSEQCDLNNTACKASTPDGLAIQLNFNPKPVPILQPITIEADLTGFAKLPEKLQLVVEGINMYMGFQKVWLEPTTSHTHYTGTLLIPTCEVTDMQWKVSVLLPSDQTVERAEFYMQTHKQ